MRLAEAIGVAVTAWRMGHALGLGGPRDELDGTVEMDEFYIGAGPRKGADYPRLGRGHKGQPRTTKTPILAVVKRPADAEEGAGGRRSQGSGGRRSLGRQGTPRAERDR